MAHKPHNSANGNSEDVAPGESGDIRKSNWWTPEREEEVVKRFDLLNKAEAMHGVVAHLYDQIGEARYRLFCLSVWKVIRDILELGGEHGITNSQLWEVYEHPQLHPYWRAETALKYGRALGLFESTKEVRLDKRGVDREQWVHRTTDTTDEMMRNLARELEGVINGLPGYARGLMVKAMHELGEIRKTSGLADL